MPGTEHGASDSGAAGGDLDVELLAAPPATGPLLARLARRSLPPLRRRSAAATPGSRGEVPARRVVVRDHAQDPERLARYARLCGYPLRDEVPATWLHVLTFPLQLQLMTAPDFPNPAVGMVHVANEMVWQRPVTAHEQLTLSCWAEGPRPHRKGVTVDLCGTAGAGDEVAWRGRSRYLVRGASVPAGGAGRPAAERDADAAGLLARARWWLPGDLGRRYAAVAGDVNPIHLHPLAARALGFPRAIAHGMWAQARVLADLGPVGRPPAGRVRVEFRSPLLLPGTAQLAARPDGSAFALTSAGGERTHLVGSLQSTDFTNRTASV